MSDISCEASVEIVNGVDDTYVTVSSCGQTSLSLPLSLF